MDSTTGRLPVRPGSPFPRALLVLQPRRERPGRLAGRDTTGEPAQRLHPRPGRRRARTFGAPAGRDQPAVRLQATAGQGQQARLADPGFTGHQDHLEPGGAYAVGRGPQRGDLRRPPDEHLRYLLAAGLGHRRRVGARRLGRAAGIVSGRTVQERVLPQDGRVQPPQRQAGVGAQLLGQPRPDPLEVRQRVGLAAAPVQAEQQLTGEPFVQREEGGAIGQLPQEAGVPAAGERQVIAVQFGGEPRRVERGPFRVQPWGVEGGERLPPPQPERLVVARRGHVAVAGRARPRNEVVEAVHVHRQRIDRQHVALWATDDRAICRGRQRFPQSRDITRQHVPDSLRWARRPHPLRELLRRHRTAQVDQQCHQHTPLPGMTDVEHPAIGACLDVPEHPELRTHQGGPRSPARTRRWPGRCTQPSARPM
ncbi:MAG TPA: hypothetical protein VFU43_29615 [Streptosporangiaceae bacterium]|nr:hypothetical protein [Streptosporangiaceae bacterium]